MSAHRVSRCRDRAALRPRGRGRREDPHLLRRRKSGRVSTPRSTRRRRRFDASSQAVYNRLVQFKPGTAEIVPGLAESWNISSDGREYTFRLRPGVKFHTTADFTPARDLDADDVIFSFERQWCADHPWYDYAGGAWPWFDGMSLPPSSRTSARSTTAPSPLCSSAPMRRSSPISPWISPRSCPRNTPTGSSPRARARSSTASRSAPGRSASSNTCPARVVRYEANPDYWRKRAAARHARLRDHPRQRRPLREAEGRRLPGDPVAEPGRPRRDQGGRRARSPPRRRAHAGLSRLQHDRAALRPCAGPARHRARHRQGGDRRRCLQGGRRRRPGPASPAHAGI